MSAGGRIAIEVEPDLKGFNSKLEGGLRGAVGVASKVGGLIGVSLGAGVAFQKVISLGNEFTVSLNTMQAVSAANAAQMDQVRERAKDLGNDASLANTSASDAAAAMTELAKGGLDVQQSMDAAKGSLQLAAAAQIDAATAAEIQAKTLNTFSMEAKDAGFVADVLANTANAASGEITDVAYAMAQGGLVAKNLGINVQDTATTLGLFAKNSLIGSDAGTSLKTMLIALTSPSKQQAAAFAELGVKAFDAEGNFVGMRTITEQLTEAQKRMTTEQFNAAAATGFGTDAVRGAAAVAQGGVAAWDDMSAAVGRSGGAAQLADAQMQGLPGALGAMQNSAETLALELYDLIDGPLESFAKTAADKIEAATPGIIDGFKNAGAVATEFGGALKPVAGFVGEVASAVADLPVPVLAALGAITALKVTGLEGLAKSTGGTLLTNMRSFNDEVRLQQSLAQLSGREVGYLGGAFGTLNSKSGGLKGILTGITGALGGPVGIGLSLTAAAAGIALGNLAEDHAKAAQKAREQEAAERALGETLDAQTGKITEATRARIAEEGREGGFLDRMKSYGLATSDYVDSIQGDPAAYDRIAKTAREHAVQGIGDNRMQSFADAGISQDELLSGLLDEGGKFDALNEKIKTFNDRQAALSYAGGPAKAALPELDALKGKMDAADESAVTLTQHINEQRGALDNAAESVRAENEALNKQLPITQSLRDAMSEYGATVESVPDDKTVIVKGLTDEAKKRLEELNMSVEKMDDGSFRVTANTDEAQAKLREMIGLIEILSKTKAIPNIGADRTEFDMNEQQARDLLAKLSTAKATPGVDLIRTKLEEGKRITLADLQELSRTTSDPKVIALIAEALGGINTVETGLNGLTANPHTVTVDANTDPATLKIDEWIRNNSSRSIAVGVYGQMLGAAPTPGPSDLAGLLLPPGAVNGRRLPGFEGGGRMPRRAATDDIYAVTPGGVPIAMVNGREWVINDEMSEEYDRELAMINAGTFPKLPGFENGGRIAAQRAHAGLAPEAGKPYGYGQVGNPSWDCSSYSGLAYALLKGLDTAVRWYTTESNFLGLGFRPGMGPSSALNIGVHNGGGGPNSHMTSMLDGVPFESNSEGVKYGNGASRPDDQQYEKQYHLPASAFNPPGDSSGAGFGVYGRQEKKATWTEKDELSLESARIAITQAQEARDRTNANGKKSQADRDQADSKVRRAEERVRALEAKKRAAETGANATAAPPAPELTTSFTDKQIRLKELQWAIDEADQKRNEVYDDPDATDKDRERADVDLVRAMNALAAEQKEQRGDSKTVGDIVGTAFKDAAVETLSGTLDFFGVSGERLMSLQASDVGGMVPPSFTEAEIARQGPEVPGTPEWAKEMIERFKLPLPANTMPQALLTPAATPGTQEWADEIRERMKIPTFLRDMGGALPSGAAALNLSGQTEWVQTAADRRRYEVDMRDLAALRAQSATSGVATAELGSMLGELRRIADRPSGPLVNIEQMNAHNADEAARAAGREALRVVRSESFDGGW
ncbi:phage tail tape measure protein [Prescottella equi]|uniref:phage tail tape measure protein n=1 Tax=Rhodococcus hoagii TaxID=43767 RepID=UPI0015857F12|nr:phage tail tape measure protein [Prescottella equi]